MALNKSSGGFGGVGEDVYHLGMEGGPEIPTIKIISFKYSG